MITASYLAPDGTRSCNILPRAYAAFGQDKLSGAVNLQSPIVLGHTLRGVMHWLLPGQDYRR